MCAYPHMTREFSWKEPPLTPEQQAAKFKERDNCLGEFGPLGKGLAGVVCGAVFGYLLILAVVAGHFSFWPALLIDILALPVVVIGALWYVMNALEFVMVQVMRDGLIVQTASLIPLKPFVDVDNHLYDWSEIEVIDFRSANPTVKTTTLGVRPYVTPKHMKPRDNAFDAMSECLFINQQRGIIPREVVLFGKLPAAPRRSFGEKVRNGVFYLAVLFGIFIVPPLYAGGGRLFDAVAPTLAEIMPDAVGKAIDAHPDWQLGTKLKLRGIALAAVATPTSLLPLFEPTDSHNQLPYALLYWILKFETRDQQVSMVASVTKVS
jgi:hypothetical protein